MQENHKTTIDMYIDLPFRDGTHGPSGCYDATDCLRVELCGTACCFVGPTERERRALHINRILLHAAPGLSGAHLWIYAALIEPRECDELTGLPAATAATVEHRKGSIGTGFAFAETINACRAKVERFLCAMMSVL